MTFIEFFALVLALMQGLLIIVLILMIDRISSSVASIDKYVSDQSALNHERERRRRASRLSA